MTTKTKDSNCAWRAHYDGGKLAAAKPGQTPEPKPTAGRQGTQITIEDLFYNVPTRRRAFRSASDEYNKIIDMVGRYAIHCDHVAFSCKKHGESSSRIAIQSSATVVDRIRQIYGGAVANELIEYGTSDDRWAFKARGWATNANYHINKTTFLLFINHRCVESTNVRKALEQTYAAFLPKSGHPFIYLSLEIDPRRVDVNVHPTKREVNFLNEDEIVQAVCEHVRSKLAAVDTSRTFTAQTLRPSGSAWPSPARLPHDGAATTTPSRPAGGGNPASSVKKTSARLYEDNLVRTDTNLRKITSMLRPLAPAAAAAATPTSSSSKVPDHAVPDGGAGGGDSLAGRPDIIEYETVDRGTTPCRLVSVKELRAAVRDDMHHELTDMFANHTFVGVVDLRRRLAAVQVGVKLYLIDYGRACFEYLYQVGLTDFGNFGTICFSPPLDLRELLTAAAVRERDATDGAEDFDVPGVVDAVASQLVERREMLLEYFALEISPAGELLSILLLVKGYTPSVAKLPRVLLRLRPHVNCTDEKRCFESFLRELATFYVPEQLPEEKEGDVTGEKAKDKESDSKRDVEDEIRARREHVRWAVEHVFFPVFKARLVATRTFMNGGVREVANLKGLYRVFERC